MIMFMESCVLLKVFAFFFTVTSVERNVSVIFA